MPKLHDLDPKKADFFTTASAVGTLLSIAPPVISFSITFVQNIINLMVKQSRDTYDISTDLGYASMIFVVGYMCARLKINIYHQAPPPSRIHRMDSRSTALIGNSQERPANPLRTELTTLEKTALRLGFVANTADTADRIITGVDLALKTVALSPISGRVLTECGATLFGSLGAIAPMRSAEHAMLGVDVREHESKTHTREEPLKADLKTWIATLTDGTSSSIKNFLWIVNSVKLFDGSSDEETSNASLYVGFAFMIFAIVAMYARLKLNIYHQHALTDYRYADEDHQRLEHPPLTSSQMAVLIADYITRIGGIAGAIVPGLNLFVEHVLNTSLSTFGRILLVSGANLLGAVCAAADVRSSAHAVQALNRLGHKRVSSSVNRMDSGAPYLLHRDDPTTPSVAPRDGHSRNPSPFPVLYSPISPR